MNIDEAFASVIRGLRKKAKLTQTDVGEFVGLTRKTVWEIEHARGSAKLSTIQKLADLYGMTMEELVKRTTIAYRDRE